MTSALVAFKYSKLNKDGDTLELHELILRDLVFLSENISKLSIKNIEQQGCHILRIWCILIHFLCGLWEFEARESCGACALASWAAGEALLASAQLTATQQTGHTVSPPRGVLPSCTLTTP